MKAMNTNAVALVLTGLLCISACNRKNGTPSTSNTPINLNESKTSPSSEELNIETVANDSKRHEGMHIRWNGYTIHAGKVGEKTLLVSVKPGYLAELTLREPLKKVLAEKTELWFEGNVGGDYPTEFTLYSPAGNPEGKAKIIGIETATIEIRK